MLQFCQYGTVQGGDALLLSLLRQRLSPCGSSKNEPKAATSPHPAMRFHSLDGLRGLAALSVVVHHYAATFFPHAVYGAQNASGSQWQDMLSRSPLFVLYSGSFSVFVFFVLSGFVIASSAASTRVPLLLLVGRRYARLTVPALCSTLAVYFLLKIFPDVTQEAARLLESRWLTGSYAHTPTLFQAMWDAVFNPYRFGDSYSNRVLWTMRNELFGSLGIYCIYLLVPRNYISSALACIFVALIPLDALTGFLGFAGGALLFQAWSKQLIRPSMLGPVLALAGLILGGLPVQSPDDTIFGPIVAIVSTFSSPFEFILGLAALTFVAGILMWLEALRVLEWSVFRFLGRISFSLYLIHYPILATVILYWFLQPTFFPMQFAALSIGYFCLSILSAYGLTILVDEPTVNKLKRAASLPKSFAFFVGHAAVLACLLVFAIFRLGPDLLSLLVMAIAYSGFFIVAPTVVLSYASPAKVEKPQSPSSHYS